MPKMECLLTYFQWAMQKSHWPHPCTAAICQSGLAPLSNCQICSIVKIGMIVTWLLVPVIFLLYSSWIFLAASVKYPRLARAALQNI